MTGPSFLAAFLMVSCALLGLDSTHTVGAETPGSPRFSALTASGNRLTGALVEIDERWAIKLGDPANKQIPGAELVELRREGVRSPRFPAGMQAILSNGDRITATS